MMDVNALSCLDGLCDHIPPLESVNVSNPANAPASVIRFATRGLDSVGISKVSWLLRYRYLKSRISGEVIQFNFASVLDRFVDLVPDDAIVVAPGIGTHELRMTKDATYPYIKSSKSRSD